MIKNVRRGDNSPMMIIAQNPRRAKDKIFFFRTLIDFVIKNNYFFDLFELFLIIKNFIQ